MARNEDNRRDSKNQHGGNDRDRRRDRIVDGVKSRPYTAAAVATLAGAAGAAAYFLSRRDSDKPLMNWGKEEAGDHVKGAGAFKPQGSTTSSRKLETASASPSSSAGVGATAGTGTSGLGSSDNRNTGTSNTSGAGMGSAKGNKGKSATGLDETAQDQTKTGSVAYGA